jgi:hypothetical protein
MSTVLHRQTFIPIREVVVRKHKLDDTIIEILLVSDDSDVKHEEIVFTVYSGIDKPAPEVINELTS